MDMFSLWSCNTNKGWTVRVFAEPKDEVESVKHEFTPIASYCPFQCGGYVMTVFLAAAVNFNAAFTFYMSSLYYGQLGKSCLLA